MVPDEIWNKQIRYWVIYKNVSCNVIFNLKGDINASQGSVATCSGCSRIFTDHYRSAHFLLRVQAKEF